MSVWNSREFNRWQLTQEVWFLHSVGVFDNTEPESRANLGRSSFVLCSQPCQDHLSAQCICFGTRVWAERPLSDRVLTEHTLGPGCNLHPDKGNNKQKYHASNDMIRSAQQVNCKQDAEAGRGWARREVPTTRAPCLDSEIPHRGPNRYWNLK